MRICNSQFKCNYLKNKKLFLDFLFHFLDFHQILNILKKNLIVIANVFPKSQTVKILVRPHSKKRGFGTRFESEHVKASQIVGKSPWESFFMFFIIARELTWKMSPLVLGEIVGVFLNTLTDDGMYPVQGCENLQLPIQMQLSGKQKYFSLFFVPFLESSWNFKHFEKKVDCHSYCISEITDC